MEIYNVNQNLNNHIEENHASQKAKYVKNIIYGGLDGIITTFSIIAAAVGANLEMKTIIAMSVANLIADGLSMGLGDYLSSHFENKYINSEKAKEEYEYIHNRDYEIEELKDLYINEGLNEEDAKIIVDILSKDDYKDIFIKHMVSLELGLELPDNNPAKDGLVTFGSFLIFGFIPVFFYIIFYASNVNYYDTFITICFISATTMFLLGCFQAYLTKQKIFTAGLIIMGNGILASSCAFGIGYGIENSIN